MLGLGAVIGGGALRAMRAPHVDPPESPRGLGQAHPAHRLRPRTREYAHALYVQRPRRDGGVVGRPRVKAREGPGVLDTPVPAPRSGPDPDGECFGGHRLGGDAYDERGPRPLSALELL